MAARYEIDIFSGSARIVAIDPTQIPPAVAAAVERQGILDRWRAELRRGPGPEKATRRFLGKLRRDGTPCCRASLFRWDTLYQRHGLAGLLDHRGWQRPGAAVERLQRQQIATDAARLDGQALTALAMFAGFLASLRRCRKPSPGDVAAMKKSAGEKTGFKGSLNGG